jgi:hypothetical protein
MVVGLDHMWVKVNENETDPSKPAHFIALLNPNPYFSLDRQERSGWDDFLAIARALLHPAALRDTVTQLFADIPPLRKVILVTALLLLCYHPCKYRTGLLAVIATGLTSVNLLANWQPDSGQSLRGTLGLILLVLALAGALSMQRLCRARPSLVVEAPPGAVPETF